MSSSMPTNGTNSVSQQAAKPWWKLSLTVQVFLALVLGVAFGVLAPTMASTLQPLATLFLHMIKMLIAPLIISTLVIGIAGHGDPKTLGRIGLKTILYFEIATTLALVIGLFVANVFQPGAGVALAVTENASSEMAAIASNAASVSHSGFWPVILHMFPTSVVDSMARGDILQIVVFSVFLALACIAAGDNAKPLLSGLESLAEVMFKFVNLVMAFAPMGVFGAIAATIGKNGVGILLVYAKLVGSLYFALLLFIVLVLVTVCWLIRVPFMRMIQAVRDPFLLAFSTASSEAALPKAMETMERFGVPKSIVSFVMPTGYTFNLDGTTLYLSLAALFVAQMAGVNLSIQEQVVMVLTLMVTSKGVAAVPRASLVILAGTLTSFGLPLEGVAVILGIDHILDMARTSVNLLGNCVATAVVARWEGMFDDKKMREFDPDLVGRPLEPAQDTQPFNHHQAAVS
jgi:proton glutamate symport protein